MGGHRQGQTEKRVAEWSLNVSLNSSTPVVGCGIDPNIRVLFNGSPINLPPHSLACSWYREKITCSVHDSKLPTVQCMSCIKLKIPAKESLHCSANCFKDAWPKHLERHCQAAETVIQKRKGGQQESSKLRSCDSWPDIERSLYLDDSAQIYRQDGKEWVKVGSSKSYVPSVDDTGFSLRLESVVVDRSTGIHLCVTNVLLTDPVIFFPARYPRCMIRLRSLLESFSIKTKAQASDGTKFKVLSYNILADIYASREDYSHCPKWALAWEYRRQNLLQEIIEYNADILCLQEVQSDQFESFIRPELAKHGYSVMYKKRALQVYTANKYTSDGCATFYRHDRFKEIRKYEVDFDKTMSSLVEALDPALQQKASIHLMKPNVALVAILEALKTGDPDGLQSRICVANTHILANPNFPDVKFCQVANLVHGLEKICTSQVPLVICGDLNSLPGSCPHAFLVRGKVDLSRERKESDPYNVYRFLKLHHSLPLVSAYASIFASSGVQEHHLRKMDSTNNEPLFTHFRPGFSGTLDYILYTANNLRVEALLELLDPETMGVGLPSPLWSSDHLALMASFRLQPTSTCRSLPQRLPPNPWQQAATAN